MTLPATDNFNRADADPIGGNWTTITGQRDGTINSNTWRSEQTGTYASGSFWNADTFADNQYTQAKASDISGGYGFMAVRCAPAVATFYFYGYWGAGSEQKMYKRVAGVDTQLGSTYTDTIAANDIVKLRVEGTTLTPSINGVDKATRTDSEIASGSSGVLGYYLDRWDDWEGGNVAAGGVYAGSWHPEIQQPVREKVEIIGY